MKLIEAIHNVDRSEDNTFTFNEEIVEAVGCDPYNLDHDNPNTERLKLHYISKWLCTDTWVGACVYYLDDMPMAISTQIARKDSINFKFMSSEAFCKLRDFFISISISNLHDMITNEEWNEEIGEFYHINYGSQLLLTKEGFYKGVPVTVVKEYKNIEKWGVIGVKFPSGEIKDIKLKNFDIPYMVKKPLT